MAILAAALAGPTARPARADDGDNDDDGPNGESTSFWADVQHPQRGRWLTLMQRGEDAMLSTRYDDAAAAFEQATVVDPTRAEGFFRLGRARKNAHHYPACAEALEHAERLSTGAAKPIGRGIASLEYNLGFCLAMSGRAEEAIARYDRVIALANEPKDEYVVHWSLGDAYMALGRLAEAEGEYQRSIESLPKAGTTEAMPHYALAVALDRDEQVDRARDEMLAALAFDRQMARLGGQDVSYLVPEDEDYYRALANEIAGNPSMAIVYFRRYLDRAADGMWARRARAHLAGLGTTALTEGEINVRPIDIAEKGTIQKTVLAAAPELQQCLEHEPLAWVRVDLTVVGATGPAPPANKGGKGTAKPTGKPGGLPKPSPPHPPTRPPVNPRPAPPRTSGVQIVSLGPVDASATALDCLTQRAKQIHVSISNGAVFVTFPVIGR